jgi:RNA polymerase sigma-70 factor (ECF subfamily)
MTSSATPSPKWPRSSAGPRPPAASWPPPPADATVIGDGGGLVSAVLRPIEGGEQIARYSVETLAEVRALTILERTVNGQPGLVTQQAGVTGAVMAFDSAGGRITRIWAVRNPEKLRPWATG